MSLRAGRLEGKKERGKMMRYGEIQYVNKPVSRILYGTAMPPFNEGKDGSALFDAMYELGINTFDTARVYGDAEKSLGKWIEERGLRKEVVILSKCAHPLPDGTKRVGEKEIRADFALSSEYLRTEYIDIYLAHRDDTDVPAGEIVEIFNALHAEGKIGAFGGSNWTHERIEEANEYAYKHDMLPFCVSSPNYGLAEQVKDLWGGGSISISGSNGGAARAWYQREKMPVIAYSSLGRGLFSGKLKSADAALADRVLDEFAMKGYAYPQNFERLRRCEELAEKKGKSVSQIAMAWLFGQELDTFAVVSTSKKQRMQENIAAMELALTKAELLYLDLREKETEK